MDAVLYARLSKDDDEPTEELRATQRQLAELRAHASEHGYRIVAEYEDSDSSAYDLKRKRPAFEAMLRDLDRDASTVTAVLCWKLDRLTRRDTEGAMLIDLANKRNIGIVSLHDPNIDLTNPPGRFMFRMLINLSLTESETISLRQRAKAAAIAATGRASGGGIRPFGLRRQRDDAGALVRPAAYEIVPEEAALIREAADRILAGEALWAIVSDWDRRGIRTPGCKASPNGRKWEVSSLKRMLIAPRIAGDRIHLGRVTGTGHIPPMLERDLYERVRVMLAARKGRPGRRTRVLFLTGIARCGVCGSRLQSAQLAGTGSYRYACRRPRGCGRVSVLAKHLEPLVAEAIAVALEGDELRRAIAARNERGDDALIDRLRADEDALSDVTHARFVERTITDPEYRRIRAELTTRIEEARSRLGGSASVPSVVQMRPTEFRSEWADLDATRRHEIAAVVLRAVTLRPSPTGGRTFSADRVGLEWVA